LLFQLLYRVDFYIVGYFLGKAVLGRYTVAVLIVEAIQKPSAWLGTILSPLVASGEDRAGLITRRFVLMSGCSVLFLGFLLCLMEVFAYDYTGRWLGEGYEGTSLIALALIPKGLAYGVMVVLGGNLAGRGYTYFHPLAGLLALVVLTTINFLLIDRIGVWGAVIASTLAMFVAALVMYRGAKVASRLEVRVAEPK
jgi:O-antigen/teichoic acid export membrane protein